MTTPSKPAGVTDFAGAAAALATLDRLAGDVRRELAQIRREIAAETARPRDARLAQLQQANEHLVRATMKAEAHAEEAVAELEELARSSQFDVLTETPNRSLMHDRMGEALAMARRHDVLLAVLYLDLDGFKQVNDTAGHAAGDEVLKCIATRLREAVRVSDTVSRQGGDEFVVLLSEVVSREAVARVAQKILEAVAQPIDVDGQPTRVSASIGIAIWPDDGDDTATLTARADEAMYAAKRAGHNAFCFAGGSSEAHAEKSPARTMSPHGLLLRDLRDVNEQLLLAALRAQELLDAAELARRRHSQAIAVLAHELRNPLAPIRTAGQWLQAAHPDDPKLEKAGAVISRQSVNMMRIIEDLLDSSRASTLGFRLERVSVPLLDVLERSIQACQTALHTRRQSLSLLLPAPTLLLDADPMRLEQVFSNLLDNASKYTPPGGQIELRAEGSPGWVTVTVSDSGIGIAPEALPHVFDLFVQEPRAQAHDGRGLGIGLAVVRELVIAHGGTVEAHSGGTGEGSKFDVRLPQSV